MLRPLVRGRRSSIAAISSSHPSSSFPRLCLAAVVSCALFPKGAYSFAVVRPIPHPNLAVSSDHHRWAYPSQRRSIHSTSLPARGRGGSGSGSKMRGVKKENLPQKVCVVCHRPFTWRKKWEKVWDEVTTCSKSCNRQRREQNRQEKNRGEEKNEEGKRRKEKAVVETMGDQIRGLDIGLAKEYDATEEEEAVVSVGQDVSDDNEHDNADTTDGDTLRLDADALRKAERKAAKKARKATRRAEREGRGDPTAGQKPCDLCGKSVDLLVRCQYKGSSGEWRMVCGRCWNGTSGGVVDGDADHPEYRYGGLWKNRRRAQKQAC